MNKKMSFAFFVVLIINVVKTNCAVTECSLVLAGDSLSPTGLAEVNLTTEETTSLATSLRILLSYAVTSDENTGQLFFNDVYNNGQIYSFNLLQSAGLSPLRFFDYGVYATAMVADTNMKVLFMVIPGENSSFIAKMNYDGTGYQEIISHPTTLSVALDERDRKLYYNDLGDTPHILRADYNGSNVEVFFLDTNLLPIYLATDAAGRKLYFSHGLTLEVINFNRSGHQVIHNFRSLALTAMTYLNGFIYFGTRNFDTEQTRLMSLQPDDSSPLRVIETYSNETHIYGMAPFCRSNALQTTTTDEPRSTTDQSENNAGLSRESPSIALQTTTADKLRSTTVLSDNNGLNRETVIMIATAVSGGVALAVGVVVVIMCCCRKRKYLADGDAYNARSKSRSRSANNRIKMQDSYLSPLSSRDHEVGNFNHEHRARNGYRPYLSPTSEGRMHGNGQYLTTNAINKQHQRSTTDIRHQYLNPRPTNYPASNSHYMNRGSNFDSGYTGSGTYYLPESDSNSFASYHYVRPIGMGPTYSTASNAYDKIPYEY